MNKVLGVVRVLLVLAFGVSIGLMVMSRALENEAARAEALEADLLEARGTVEQQANRLAALEQDLASARTAAENAREALTNNEDMSDETLAYRLLSGSLDSEVERFNTRNADDASVAVIELYPAIIYTLRYTNAEDGASMCQRMATAYLGEGRIYTVRMGNAMLC